MLVLQVNTRQQTERVAKKGKNSPAHQLPAAGGTLIQIFQVIKNEGFGGLYSGLRPSLLGTAASQVADCDQQLFPLFNCLLFSFLLFLYVFLVEWWVPLQWLNHIYLN